MIYELYYTSDGVRSAPFESLNEVHAAYASLPRKLKPAWVCDADGHVVLGIRPSCRSSRPELS
jgi:hypothetical protein